MHGAKGIAVIQDNSFYYILQVMMIATASITVYSGYEYFIKNKQLYMESM